MKPLTPLEIALITFLQSDDVPTVLESVLLGFICHRYDIALISIPHSDSTILKNPTNECASCPHGVPYDLDCNECEPVPECTHGVPLDGECSDCDANQVTRIRAHSMTHCRHDVPNELFCVDCKAAPERKDFDESVSSKTWRERSQEWREVNAFLHKKKLKDLWLHFNQTINTSDFKQAEFAYDSYAKELSNKYGVVVQAGSIIKFLES